MGLEKREREVGPGDIGPSEVKRFFKCFRFVLNLEIQINLNTS